MTIVCSCMASCCLSELRFLKILAKVYIIFIWQLKNGNPKAQIIMSGLFFEGKLVEKR